MDFEIGNCNSNERMNFYQLQNSLNNFFTSYAEVGGKYKGKGE